MSVCSLMITFFFTGKADDRLSSSNSDVEYENN